MGRSAFRLQSGSGFEPSGEFGVKQVLREVPDILPGRFEGKIPAREVSDTEVTGDHGTSNRERDDESFHDSIASLGLRDGFLSGTEIGGKSATFQVRYPAPDGHDECDHEGIHQSP